MVGKKFISYNLQQLRKAHDLTQVELADIVGKSRHAIVSWENGDTFPDS